MTISSTYENHMAKHEDIDLFPVSLAQQRLWFLHQLEPTSSAYNLTAIMHLNFALNVRALQESLHSLRERQEMLRAGFVAIDGLPKQVITSGVTLPLSVVDLSSLPEQKRQEEALRLKNQEAQEPFDLGKAPLLRVRLLKLAEQNFLLLVTFHHIIIDEWSINIFFQELAAFYNAYIEGKPSPLPPSPLQYVDFAIWQQEYLKSNELSEQLAYWKQQLAGAPTTLELPFDRPRPTSPRSSGSHYLMTLSKELVEALKALSNQQGVTLYMTLIAVFQCLLARYSSQEDIVLGTVTAGRTLAGTESLLGFFVNTLVLRTDLSGNPTFYEVLGRVREVFLQAHQDVPFDYLIKELQPERIPGQNPLFQVALIFDPPLPTLPAGWELSKMVLETGMSEFDLSLELTDGPDGLACRFEYSTDMFDAATILRMAGHWQTLLEGIVDAPTLRLAELPLLTEQERRQLLVEWNATQEVYPADKCIHQIFEAQVERTPDLVAVVFEGQQLTYRELNQQANQLAHYLCDLGVGPESLVSLLTMRGTPLLIAILAVFKAGGAYLPLDPDHPAARIQHILMHSNSHLVLAAWEFAPVLSQVLMDMEPESRPQVVYLGDLQFRDGYAEDNLSVQITPGNLAYVIYTSGSTGMPKGAMIEHRGMLNHIYAKINGLQLTEADNVAQTASQCFDISVWQMLAILAVGGQVHILPDTVAHDPAYLLEHVDRYSISILETVPSLLRSMLEVYEADGGIRPPLKRLRWLIPTGEALSADLCRRWLHLYPHIPLLNAYGPTECSDDVTHHHIYHPPAETENYMPIGKALMNTRLYVLDSRLIPVPVGVKGELYVGGVGVGRGYLNDEQRTAQSFIPDPFSSEPGVRLYKTGDVARYLPDGTLEFLGRVDHQVKIRGFRIELGEIEAQLSQIPEVKEAAVVAYEGEPGTRHLVAYLVTLSGQQLSIRYLRETLLQRLPEYMLPSAFVFLVELPLNSNGKIDRKALPAIDQIKPQLGEAFIAPRTPVEETLASIWGEILGLERIGIQDNFFALGGHSLLATQVALRLQTALEVEVPLRIFFEAPTIAQLAEIIPQLKAQRVAPQMPTLGTFSREVYRVPKPYASTK